MHRHHRMAHFGRHLLHHLSPHHLWHAMGRHRHGHGHGHGGPFGGGFDGDGEGFTRGRKFSSDDLQLMLLALLEEKPSHGYELIKALDARSGGFYSPSPGMVYPALTYLEEIGYATVETSGNKKCYHLADAGRSHLDANRERAMAMMEKLGHIGRKMEWMRRAMAGEQPGEEEGQGWIAELMEARRAIKRALYERSVGNADEQRRIAAILMRAVAEILDGRRG